MKLAKNELTKNCWENQWAKGMPDNCVLVFSHVRQVRQIFGTRKQQHTAILW